MDAILKQCLSNILVNRLDHSREYRYTCIETKETRNENPSKLQPFSVIDIIVKVCYTRTEAKPPISCSPPVSFKTCPGFLSDNAEQPLIPENLHFSHVTHWTYICFFCAAGPISLSKAPYETCKLPKAERPAPRIESKMIKTNRPMKTPLLRPKLVSCSSHCCSSGAMKPTRSKKLILLKQRPSVPFG